MIWRPSSLLSWVFGRRKDADLSIFISRILISQIPRPGKILIFTNNL
jgi:hypothetical protein